MAVLRVGAASASSDDDDLRIIMDWHWVLGAGLAVAAAFISNLGLNLQKLSHLENMFEDPLKRERPKPVSSHTPMLLRPKWLLGARAVGMGPGPLPHPPRQRQRSPHPHPRHLVRHPWQHRRLRGACIRWSARLAHAGCRALAH